MKQVPRYSVVVSVDCMLNHDWEVPAPCHVSGGDFLVNGSQLALGVRQNGQPVNNVQLPAWATGPDDMLAKHR